MNCTDAGGCQSFMAARQADEGGISFSWQLAGQMQGVSVFHGSQPGRCKGYQSFMAASQPGRCRDVRSRAGGLSWQPAGQMIPF